MKPPTLLTMTAATENGPGRLILPMYAQGCAVCDADRQQEMAQQNVTQYD